MEERHAGLEHGADGEVENLPEPRQGVGEEQPCTVPIEGTGLCTQRRFCRTSVAESCLQVGGTYR